MLRQIRSDIAELFLLSVLSREPNKRQMSHSLADFWSPALERLCLISLDVINNS